MDQEKVISDDVASYFVSNGQMGPVIEQKRKFSALLITSASSISASPASVNSANSESFQATHRYIDVPFIEVPITLLSVESYVYMGFTEIAARQIWNRFINRPHDMPDSFLDFAYHHVNLSPEPDVHCADEDWDGCLCRCGINEHLRAAILMTEFQDIRHSQSAKYWAMDAIGMNYEALRTIDERLREEMHAQFNIGQRRQPGYTFSSDDRPQPSSSSSLVQGKEKMEHSARPVTTEVKSAPVSPPGYTTLWKAVTKKGCEGFIDPMTQELMVKVLASTAPSDFSSDHRLVYFTPQKAVADRYASWAKHKAPNAEIAIVQVNVPFSFSEQKINGKPFSYLLQNSNNPENEWRQVVWHSKGYVQEPRSLRHIRHYGLLIGHCTTGLKIERLAHHSLVGDEHMLKVNGSGTMVSAIQWALQGYDAEADFDKQCRGMLGFGVWDSWQWRNEFSGDLTRWIVLVKLFLFFALKLQSVKTVRGSGCPKQQTTNNINPLTDYKLTLSQRNYPNTMSPIFSTSIQCFSPNGPLQLEPTGHEKSKQAGQIVTCSNLSHEGIRRCAIFVVFAQSSF